MTYTSESDSSDAEDLPIPEEICETVEEKDDDVLESEKLNTRYKVDEKPPTGLLSTKKVHKCNIDGCSARFSRPWRLEAHIAVHLGEKPFPCDYEGCQRAYTSNYHLRRHKLQAHTETPKQEYYECEYEHCKKVFTLIQNARKHYKRAHIQKRCKTCDEHFYSTAQLKRHKKIHKIGYNLKCSDCNITFEHEGKYYRHKRGHRLHVCPAKGCIEAFYCWTQMRKHLAIHPFDYVCGYCNKGYRTKKFLKAHILKHMNNEESLKRKPYTLKKVTCNFCHAELLGKGSLKRHVRNLHETDRTNRPIIPRKPREPRKDKGIPKRALAVVLSQAIVPKEVEKELIRSSHHFLVPES